MYERRFNFCITGQLFTFVLQPIRIMRESSFIKNNKDKWKEFEYASTEGFDDPDYNEYGLPAFAGGTGDFIKIPPAPVVSWPWRKG